MMIDKRLLSAVPESKRYIAANVALQWLALAANMVLVTAVCRLLTRLWAGTALSGDLAATAGVAVVALAVRFACAVGAARMSYLSSRWVKTRLRGLLYEKLLRLGTAYRESVQTSEVVQVAVEGVDQLEIYFGQYLPQFFYAMLAPLTLFAVLAPIDLPSAAVLLLCVPLIPASIAAVQTWAKKLLGRYWGQYTALGDTFLENLQGLTTLKIYEADDFKNREMNAQAEAFRKITMRVLTMQLNSITIMDLIAYGGAAAGMILAVSRLAAGAISLQGCLMILLLAADFFLPMRLLGSFFHVAMNGMAASEKIFRLLDTPEPARGNRPAPADCTLALEAVDFAFEEARPILRKVTMQFPKGSFTALVGESGCGKSTVAALLTGRRHGQAGRITLGGVPLGELDEASLAATVTYLSHNSYLFKGTVRDNLRMAAPDADDAALWKVLEQVRLADFLRAEQGLDTPLQEKASNLSGGQCQRLALARALLHDTPVYIFDEATSNIDVESENDIMALIRTLACRKTVILISHRLANVTGADKLYLLAEGRVAEAGTHTDLLAAQGAYARLWNAQQQLEHYTGQEVSA
ncbi:ABC transporter ATP-binding protein/permease [Subdoligranulum variabile]|uniref:ABC transporter, ATP-binding protein n=1 Tax=Subdoligranulum variabile DSM 15176 TaxID=411471 RepID=D1PIL2_9FIRM|nr:ATP-binding cassette domain-containing protein [Subdoligranulum variabile]EFB77371.1 ABC transporter, ATP-binding protein [Subdoligranulum variabile DSM 15176]UWP67266.1 ATP-binding cassette domain-containing protein [Subdoligranulum variabile]